MADDAVDTIDARLKDWARWVTIGRSSEGFPKVNVLHTSWLPPTPGSTPTLRVSRMDDKRHRAMHAAIGALSMRLANTVVVHYCYRLTDAEQCERLGCARSTLHQRLQSARRQISENLMAIERSLAY